MLLCFKVNEHLKDIIEQEQKLREHVPAEAPGGQKVGVSEERRCGRGAAAPGAGRDGTGRGGVPSACFWWCHLHPREPGRQDRVRSANEVELDDGVRKNC